MLLFGLPMFAYKLFERFHHLFESVSAVFHVQGPHLQAAYVAYTVVSSLRACIRMAFKLGIEGLGPSCEWESGVEDPVFAFEA